MWLIDHASSALLVPLVYVTVMTWGGWSRPSPVLVLEGAQFVVLAPAWLVLGWSAVRRRGWSAAVALFVAISHLAFTIPAATADSVPAWTDEAPSFSLLSANVLYENESPKEVAELVAEIDADVVILNEVTEQQFVELDRAGALERYPTQVFTRGEPFGELLLTRLPTQDTAIPLIGGYFVPSADVVVGDRAIGVFAIHSNAPKNSVDRALWRRNLHGIATTAAQRGDQPQLYAGDFNSTLWHGPFRDMLNGGLTDAHDALGKGLSRSWTPKVPGVRALGPIMQIDHAVFTPGLFPTSIDEVVVPGSDHRGFVMEMTVLQDDA